MATREEWAKRVQRWSDSDLTAKEFAAELGINARTLSYWKWKLGKEGRGEQPRTQRPRSERRDASLPATTFIEVTPPAPIWAEASSRIEVVVDERYVVRVPEMFEPSTLRLVLSTLAEASL